MHLGYSLEQYQPDVRGCAQAEQHRRSRGYFETCPQLPHPLYQAHSHEDRDNREIANDLCYRFLHGITSYHQPLEVYAGRVDDACTTLHNPGINIISNLDSRTFTTHARTDICSTVCDRESGARRIYYYCKKEKNTNSRHLIGSFSLLHVY